VIAADFDMGNPTTHWKGGIELEFNVGNLWKSAYIKVKSGN